MAMSTSTNSGGPILRPEDVGRLLVQPMMDASVASQVASSVITNAHEYRVPVVASDPRAAWTPEGAEIDASDQTLTETRVTPAKLAGLSVISSELAEDSSPSAAEAVGQGLARDIARQVDAAFFGNQAAPAPAGLESLSTTTVDAGAEWANLDAFAEAIAAAENEHAQVDTFVTSPADALTLARLKHDASAESNVPLLGGDNGTEETQRRVLGVTLAVSPAVSAGTVWAIPRDRVSLVIRRDSKVDVDQSAYFSSDRVGVRATMRVGFAFPHPAAVAKISLSSA